MSEVKIATRESYGNALVECAKENPDIVVLDADLAEATKTIIFKKAFPETRYSIASPHSENEKTTADAVAKLQGLETAETERVVIPYANSPMTMQI